MPEGHYEGEGLGPGRFMYDAIWRARNRVELEDIWEECKKTPLWKNPKFIRAYEYVKSAFVESDDWVNSMRKGVSDDYSGEA